MAGVGGSYNRAPMKPIRLALLLIMLGGHAWLTGCRKPLFPEDAQRSPYERYQALRGRAAPTSEPNAFGREQPALRQRLRPLEQP